MIGFQVNGDMERMGWINIHVEIDSDAMNVVSLMVVDEYRSDTGEFKKALEPVIEKTPIVYGDRGYDGKSDYEYLYNDGVSGIILPGKNAASRSRGSPRRAKVARALKKIPRNMEGGGWKHSFHHLKEPSVK